MKNKKILTILIVVVVLILASVYYFFVLNKDNNQLQQGNSATKEPDTSNWKIYRNEELGFEFKYPNECSMIGSPVGIIGVGGCFEKAYLIKYANISFYHENFNDMEIEQIANTWHTAMKEEENSEKRLLSEVEKIKLNKLNNAYKFIFDTSSCDGSLAEDYSCTGGRLVEEVTGFIFFESQNGKKVRLMIPEDNIYSQKILETIK